MTPAAEMVGSDDSENSRHGPRLDDPAHRHRVTGPKRRSTVGGWTPELDKLLMEARDKFQGKCWKKIAEMVPGKTDVQCLHRYQKVLNPSVNKGPWTLEDDNHLIQLVEKLGDKKWSEIAKDLPGRNGKQCRERWNNHLKPSIDKSRWSKDEDSIIMRACHENGNKWAEISKLLPGRTENSIKNRFNSNLKKKLAQWNNPENLDEHLILQGYPFTPLLEHKRNNDVKNASEPLKDRNHSSSSSYSIWRRRKEAYQANLTNHCNASRHGQTSTSDYSLSSLTSESCLASPETSLASPSVESQFQTIFSLEAIIRRRARTYKYLPSIIRKRHIKATPDENETTPCNKNQRCVLEDDEAVSLELSLSLPSELKRSVEKRLESEFDAVWDSSKRGDKS